MAKDEVMRMKPSRFCRYTHKQRQVGRCILHDPHPTKAQGSGHLQTAKTTSPQTRSVEPRPQLPKPRGIKAYLRHIPGAFVMISKTGNAKEKRERKRKMKNVSSV